MPQIYIIFRFIRPKTLLNEERLRLMEKHSLKASIMAFVVYPVIGVFVCGLESISRVSRFSSADLIYF